MGVITDGRNITMTRGDTLRLNVEIYTLDKTRYYPAVGDSMRFALKQKKYNKDRTNYFDAKPLINKEIVDAVLVLDPEDTQNLNFGEYVYDVEITLAGGDVCTIIPHADFVIAEEVGRSVAGGGENE